MRRHLVTTVLTIAMSIGLVHPAAAHAASSPSVTALRRQADRWMSVSLPGFVDAKRVAPAPYDWTDDGCSVVPDQPFGYAFHDACTRHDFGYRNYGRGLRLDPTPARRKAIDRRFLSDLLRACVAVKPIRVRPRCVGLALTYYEGVRHLGFTAFD